MTLKFIEVSQILYKTCSQKGSVWLIAILVVGRGKFYKICRWRNLPNLPELYKLQIYEKKRVAIYLHNEKRLFSISKFRDKW